MLDLVVFIRNKDKYMAENQFNLSRRGEAIGSSNQEVEPPSSPIDLAQDEVNGSPHLSENQVRPQNHSYFLPPNQPDTVPFASDAFCSIVRSAWSTSVLILSRASWRNPSSFSLPSRASSGMRSSNLNLERALSICAWRETCQHLSSHAAPPVQKKELSTQGRSYRFVDGGTGFLASALARFLGALPVRELLARLAGVN